MVHGSCMCERIIAGRARFGFALGEKASLWIRRHMSLVVANEGVASIPWAWADARVPMATTRMESTV